MMQLASEGSRWRRGAPSRRLGLSPGLKAAATVTVPVIRAGPGGNALNRAAAAALSGPNRPGGGLGRTRRCWHSIMTLRLFVRRGSV